MSTKFVAWASAHRSDMVGQSPTLQRLTGRGFTITEIILVLVLICLLIFLMIRDEPDWRRLSAYEVKQRAQHKSIDTALELFNSEFDGYPPSDALDEDGRPYCGAMKLDEAMMGRDLMGYHPDSVFRRDGTDGKGTLLYPDANDLSEEAYRENLSVRNGPYLPNENGNPCRLKDLYGNVGPFDGNEYVLCDVWRGVTHFGTGKRGGMPILYYKADTSKTVHDVNDPNNPENIYNYKDNHKLLALGVPGKPDQKHPLYEDPKIFYEIAMNEKVAGPRPYRADTYILLSAGPDGLYGTEDDIANFDFRWKPK
jgi:type II secretory pathway pseudopilin PulG